MRILIASVTDNGAIERLREDHDVVCAFGAKEEPLKWLIRDRDVLIFRSGVNITAEVMASSPNLKLVIRAGCGLDNVDLAYIKAHGIRFLTIPEPAAQAVAEMAFAFMLALARNLREADRLLRQGRWAKYELEGHLLARKVLGIVGAGNIGTRLGELAVTFGMKPIGCVEEPSPSIAAELRKKGIRLASFGEVVSSADFLSIHVPLSESTRNLIDARILSQMKRGSFLINLARGGVVDEVALYRELVDGGRLRGAALDVHREEGEGKISPLAALPNVLLTPHIGAMTVDTQREIGRRVVEIVESFAPTPSAVKEAGVPVG